jgi:ferredoxin-NADP reductase
LRPFTFTSRPGDSFLEFTIKSYTDHSGVTNKLGTLSEGDFLQISDSWGAVSFHGEGVFIAGGAGITPFLAILRDLFSKGNIGNNRLFFANKTASDIIYREELEKMLGKNIVNILSAEENTGYENGRINKAWIQKQVTDFSVPFYVCGPDTFTSDILKALEELGAKPDTLVFEK